MVIFVDAPVALLAGPQLPAKADADADAFQSVRAAPIHGKVDIKALYGMASYISGSSSIEGMPISQSWVAR